MTQTKRYGGGPFSMIANDESVRESERKFAGSLIDYEAAKRKLHSQSINIVDDIAISFAQSKILIHLPEDEAISISQLADRVNVSNATMTQVLRPLEELQLISRTKDSSDGRITNVQLTDLGKSTLDQLRNEFYNLWDKYLEDFSEEEVDAAARVMSTLSTLFNGLN